LWIPILLAAAASGSQLIHPVELSADGFPMILSLGDDSYIGWSAIESHTGAIVKRELGENRPTDFSVQILSNVSYASLPEALRGGFQEYVARGGSVLITGGQQSYGSGGYADTEIANLIPLRPSRDDWLPHPFGPTLLLEPGHPILRGIEIPTMAFFNELDLGDGAVEIAQYRKASKAGVVGGRDPGGGQVQGGGRRPMPLIAERSVGTGTILAIALDMTLTGDWRDRDRFAQNCVEYLLQRSRIEAPKDRSRMPE
jgi:hypothetical protein